MQEGYDSDVGGELIRYACLVAAARDMRARDDADTIHLFFVACHEVCATCQAIDCPQRKREWGEVREPHGVRIVE